MRGADASVATDSTDMVCSSAGISTRVGSTACALGITYDSDITTAMGTTSIASARCPARRVRRVERSGRMGRESRAPSPPRERRAAGAISRR